MKKKVTICIIALLLVFAVAYSLIPVEKLILFLPYDKVIQADDSAIPCRLINLSLKVVDFDGPYYVLECCKDNEWIHCTRNSDIRFEAWRGYLHPFHMKDFDFYLKIYDPLQAGEYRIRKTMEYNGEEFYVYCYFTIV